MSLICTHFDLDTLPSSGPCPLHTFPGGLWPFNRQDPMSLHRLTTPKEGVLSAFFPETSFFIRVNSFLYCFIIFYPTKEMRLTFEYDFIQIKF